MVQSSDRQLSWANFFWTRDGSSCCVWSFSQNDVKSFGEMRSDKSKGGFVILEGVDWEADDDQSLCLTPLIGQLFQYKHLFRPQRKRTVASIIWKAIKPWTSEMFTTIRNFVHNEFSKPLDRQLKANLMHPEAQAPRGRPDHVAMEISKQFF